MLENWLCFVAELGIQNYFVISDSREQAERLSVRGHSAFHLDLRAHGNRSLDYGTIGYKQVGMGGWGASFLLAPQPSHPFLGFWVQFILERTRMVRSILRLGFHVLLADVDAVWLSNPFLHMTNPRVDIYAQLEPSGFLCGGFLYLRSTPLVIALWTKVTAMFEKTVARMVEEASGKLPEEIPKWLKV